MELPKRSSWVFGAAAGALLVALACGRDGGDTEPRASAPPAGSGKVVARLNGDPITIDDLRGGFPGALLVDPGPALENAVARRLVAQEARRRGLDATEDVRAQIEALRREAAAREDALLSGALPAALAQQQSISEEELRAHYERTKDRYTQPRLRLRRVAFPSAEEARAEDDRLGPDGRLDPAASEEIGPASREQLMRMQLFGLMRLQQPGQRIVVEREGSFALIELVEQLPPAPPPFEEVRERLESELRSQKAAEAFAKLSQELRAAARLEVDEAALKEEAAAQPPAGEAGPLRRPWR